MQNIHSKMRDEQTHTNARAAPTLKCTRVQAFFQFKFTERSASQAWSRSALNMSPPAALIPHRLQQTIYRVASRTHSCTRTCTYLFSSVPITCMVRCEKWFNAEWLGKCQKPGRLPLALVTSFWLYNLSAIFLYTGLYACMGILCAWRGQDVLFSMYSPDHSFGPLKSTGYL